MALTINAPQGEIKNLKYRKEGNGADGAVPLDVKVSCVCNGSVLKTLIGSDNTASFWRAGKDKELMFPWLGLCKSNSKFKYCQLNVGGVELKDASLSGFQFTCMEGGSLELEFNAAVPHLGAKETEKMKGFLKGGAIPIKCTGGDLVDMAEDDDEEDPEAGKQKDLEDPE